MAPRYIVSLLKPRCCMYTLLQHFQNGRIDVRALTQGAGLVVEISTFHCPSKQCSPNAQLYVPGLIFFTEASDKTAENKTKRRDLFASQI